MVTRLAIIVGLVVLVAGLLTRSGESPDAPRAKSAQHSVAAPNPVRLNAIGGDEPGASDDVAERLVAHVYDAFSRAPIPGAKARLQTGSGSSAVVADTAGKVVFEVRSPEADLDVHFSAPGYQPVIATISPPKAARVSLTPVGAIAVRVLDAETDEPLVGASVIAQSGRGSPGPARVARSDLEGAVTLGGLTVHRPLQVRASSPGFGPQSRRVVPLGATPTSILLRLRRLPAVDIVIRGQGVAQWWSRVRASVTTAAGEGTLSPVSSWDEEHQGARVRAQLVDGRAPERVVVRGALGQRVTAFDVAGLQQVDEGAARPTLLVDHDASLRTLVVRVEPGEDRTNQHDSPVYWRTNGRVGAIDGELVYITPQTGYQCVMTLMSAPNLEADVVLPRDRVANLQPATFGTLTVTELPPSAEKISVHWGREPGGLALAMRERPPDSNRVSFDLPRGYYTLEMDQIPMAHSIFIAPGDELVVSAAEADDRGSLILSWPPPHGLRVGESRCFIRGRRVLGGASTVAFERSVPLSDATTTFESVLPGDYILELDGGLDYPTLVHAAIQPRSHSIARVAEWVRPRDAAAQVVDPHGAPVPHLQLTVQPIPKGIGTSAEVVTDLNGRFVIRAPADGEVLVTSSLGAWRVRIADHEGSTVVLRPGPESSERAIVTLAEELAGRVTGALLLGLPGMAMVRGNMTESTRIEFPGLTPEATVLLEIDRESVAFLPVRELGSSGRYHLGRLPRATTIRPRLSTSEGEAAAHMVYPRLSAVGSIDVAWLGGASRWISDPRPYGASLTVRGLGTLKLAFEATGSDGAVRWSSGRRVVSLGGGELDISLERVR